MKMGIAYRRCGKVAILSTVLLLIVILPSIWLGRPYYCQWVNAKLLAAVENEDVDEARRWIRCGASVKWLERTNAPSLLQLAISRDNPGLVELLVQNGADANSVGKDGSNGLLIAKSVSVAEKLVRAGAEWECNPLLLEYYISQDKWLLLTYFLELGLDPNIQYSRLTRFNDYVTLIDMAAQANASGCCRALVDAGASVKGSAFSSPLLIAVSLDNVEVSKVLLESGADMDYRTFSGDGPIDVAGTKCRALLQSYKTNPPAPGN